MNIIGNINHELSEKCIGRIGGNIPEFFLDKCEELKDYFFYLTFKNNNFNDFISVFVHRNFSFLLENNRYPDIAVKIFTHAESFESQELILTNLDINKTYIDGFFKVDGNKYDFVTFSKEPDLIQSNLYYRENVINGGFEFYVQIDEDYYMDESVIKEDYIFGGGALYIYRNSKDNSLIAGFWQVG